jgi:hypothetical protein
LLVLFFGLIELLTGAEFSTEILYLLPIFLSTWLTGWWGGAFISLVSALAWLATDIAFGVGHTNPAIPYWNVFVRLVSYLLMTYLFSELKLARERRRNLESIFFHDIYNVIGAIRGAAELLANSDPVYKQELCRIIVEASDQAADEIDIQKTMAAMENHELQVNPSPINSKTLLEQVLECYQHHNAGQNRTIALSHTSQEAIFESDQALLSRVLGNGNGGLCPGAGWNRVLGPQSGGCPRQNQEENFPAVVFRPGTGKRSGDLQHAGIERTTQGKGFFHQFRGGGDNFPCLVPP